MKHFLTLAAIGLAVASGPVFAQAELAKQKNCMACHAVDKKLVGPSYKDVAAKYKADKDAGVWGQVPMPANPQVNDAEATSLAKWVLAQ